MSDLATRNNTVDLGVIERVIALGDLAKLSPEERARYYFEVCRSVGLNPLTRPFEYLLLNGKLLLYARKDATDQLRKLHRISLEITGRETVGDLYVVTARARTPDGRTDEEIGAVSIKGLAGDALANAFMKASTKSKRRVTLSVCGLGLLEESELETVRDAVPFETDRVIGRRQIEDEPAALPASSSGAAARLQAEIDALDPPPEVVVAGIRADEIAEAKSIARGIYGRMREINPDTTVDFPKENDPLNVWTSWIDTWGPAVDKAEKKRAASA